MSIYFERNWLFETLYLLATVDYLCRLENIVTYTKYDDYRKLSLQETYYPSSLQLLSKLSHNSKILNEYLEKSIPEFKQFNIVEMDIFSVE